MKGDDMDGVGSLIGFLVFIVGVLALLIGWTDEDAGR
jgi:hypothetical protein